jgi:hypothetical protein
MANLNAFLGRHVLHQLGHGQRLEHVVALDQDTAVGADGHGAAQRLLARPPGRRTRR